MTRVYAGLDAGSTTCVLSAVDASGKGVSEQSFATSEANIIVAAKSLKGEVHVHLEASTLAGWIRRVVKPLVARVVVSDPKQNAWIGRDPAKRDELDAYKLAELLRLNRVHEVYYPDEEDRADFKAIVQQYEDVTQEQVSLKMKIKARFKALGVLATGLSVYSEEGREEYLDRVKSEVTRAGLNEMYKLMDAAKASQLRLRRLMTKTGGKYPEIARLQTVPGVGPVNACRFSAYIQTPHRFANRSKLWRYCRLAVTQRSSDGKPLGPGRLDRSGCGSLKDVSRKAFEGAMHCKADNAFQRMYHRILRRTRNSTHARLAVQRKIVNVMASMWRSQTDYQDNKG